jgi:hypothetical protein
LFRVTRPVGLFLRNEQLSLTTIRQSDRNERALDLAIWHGDRVGVGACHTILLLDLLTIHRLDVPCARRA